MSFSAMAQMAEMQRKMDEQGARLLLLAQAVESLAKHSEALQERVVKLEEKRGPGRPPKHG